MKSIYKLIAVLLIFPFAFANSQNNATVLTADSMSLNDVLSSVMKNYPAFKKANNDLTAADAKIGLTKTAYLPDINFSSSYTRLGPTTSIAMSIGGVMHSLQLYPENMYNATISVNENIYDFGRTNKNLALDENTKGMVKLSTEQLKQKLSTLVMGNYYGICLLQEAIRIKDDQLNTLNQHLEFVQKKESTGSATKYDILTTKVRISVIENQKTDLQAALQVQVSQMNSFLGKPQETPVLLKKEIYEPQIVPAIDSLCNVAYQNRTEMKMAHQKEEIAKSRLNVIKVQNNPSLNAFASGGYKNGYFNSTFQDTGMMNFAVGVGLKVPIFDANRSKYSKIQANADLESNQEDTELTRRNITNEVVESRANADAALKKVRQSELQLQQALQAYDLADVSYKTGSITNLDLLESYTAVSESKLGLLKSKVDYTVSLLKLKLALGEQIY